MFFCWTIAGACEPTAMDRTSKISGIYFLQINLQSKWPSNQPTTTPIAVANSTARITDQSTTD